MGGPLTKPPSTGAARAKTRNLKFRRDELNNEINRMNFKGPLKVPCINAFIKLQCYLGNGSECPPPLTKPGPIGVSRSKREI